MRGWTVILGGIIFSSIGSIIAQEFIGKKFAEIKVRFYVDIETIAEENNSIISMVIPADLQQLCSPS